MTDQNPMCDGSGKTIKENTDIHCPSPVEYGLCPGCDACRPKQASYMQIVPGSTRCIKCDQPTGDSIKNIQDHQIFCKGRPTQPPPKEKECNKCFNDTEIRLPDNSVQYICSCPNPSKEETNRQWAEELLTIGNEPDEYIPYKQDRETLIRRVADALTQAFERGKKEGRAYEERTSFTPEKMLEIETEAFAKGRESGIGECEEMVKQLDIGNGGIGDCACPDKVLSAVASLKGKK